MILPQMNEEERMNSEQDENRKKLMNKEREKR